MSFKLWLLLFYAAFSTIPALAQQAVITGMVRDVNGSPMELVNVAVVETSIGTYTDSSGRYQITVPAGKPIQIVYIINGIKPVFKSITPQEGDLTFLNATLEGRYIILDAPVIKADRGRDPGSIYIDPAESQYMAGPVSGIEGMIKMQVGFNNELTSQYTVRGGNYDENLVYVNDFEIYRPFLTRSGQQEGLGFVNTDLAAGVSFSLGGFQAKYGDKMSSVLDVTYRKPKHFAGTASASLLGASLALEGNSYNEKFTYLLGFRQKSNQYLLQSQPTKGVYNPSFTDIQTLLTYHITKKWDVEFIGNYARNRFVFQPEEATSSFGVVNRAFQLRVFYDGGEIDQFDSRFGGLSTTYRPNDKLSLKFLGSAFQTDERETYDITGEYLLGELETDLGKENFGQVKTAIGTGIIQNFARNYLEVNVGNIGHRGSLTEGKHYIQWGLDFNTTSINDKLHEWERRDSAGYTQPALQNELVMQKLYNSSASFDYQKVSGFVQDNFRFNDSLDLVVSAGARVVYNTLNNETIVSPRLQVSYKPRWKKDILFKAATGLYAQPPFYREMRDLEGTVNKNLKAQKSWHYLLGTDINFVAIGKPLKITTEVYYKNMWDLVPYEYDNVRIRYFGENSAKGYAYGAEARLYGELVKGLPSWLSIGYLNTKEDINNDSIITTRQIDSVTTVTEVSYPGYIPRPTDQRMMFGMYFQDHLPGNKNFRAHLSLIYATGLPFGPPDNQRYGDTLRLPDYRRVDIGFSALLLDGARKERPRYSFFSNINSIWMSVEVFNLLGIQNTLSYTLIQDQTSSKSYFVPNRLTSRLLNVKFIVKF